MAANNLAAYGIGQVSNVEIQDALAQHVRQSFTAAKEHKDNTGITQKLLRNLRAKRCEYEPEDLQLLGPGNDVYIGLSALKARAAKAWLTDIILNNIDKPWTLSSTPEPDLPEEAKDQIVEALVLELPLFNSLAALKDRAKTIKSIVQAEVKDAADLTTQRMETRIEDQMAEGGWANTFDQFTDDLTTFPTAFLRGPFTVAEAQPYWDGTKLNVKHSSILKVRTISPFNAFPAPNASSPQNGDYFIEAIEYSRSDVHDLIGVEGFLAGNVRQALATYNEGFSLNNSYQNEAKILQDKEQGITATKTGIDVLIYNGKIEGRYLAEHGVLVEDLQKYYECEVWVAGDYTIRAVLTPNPLGTRPLYGTSYVKINGSIWGQSVICLTYDTMRICNAACRAMVRNMGYASGPIGEVVSDRLADGEDPTDLTPYRIFQVGPDLTGTGAPAFKFHNVTAIGSDLMAIFERFMKVADDLSGVPAYVLGNPQVAGAGRTLGGLSMLMGNAAKGIKNVQLNIDKDVIEGVVSGFYYYNMLMSDDMGIKGDAKVQARGAMGLLQRELSQTRTVEILQLLTPYVQAELIDKQALDYILREILKNTGMDVDRIIPDPERGAELENILSLLGSNGGGQAQAMERGTSNPVSLPPQSVPQVPSQAIPQPVNLAQGS